MFNYISCPNHFGEIIEWFGFAIMTWSLPGLSFAIWTVCNLLPRAIHHHAWYKQSLLITRIKGKSSSPLSFEAQNEKTLILLTISKFYS